MTHRLAFLSIVLVLAVCSLAPASPQPPGAGTAPAATAPAATQPASLADEAFEQLRRDFRNLVDSLRNQGGMTAGDEPIVRAMRDRAAKFSQQFPDDRRGVAIQLQISMWLKDEQQVNDLFARLARAAPDDPDVPVYQAEYLINRNRFAEAIDALRAHQFDPEKTPRAYALLAKALYAEERFDEAAEALRAIPADALERDLMLKMQDVQPIQKGIDEAPALWAVEKALRESEERANDLPRATIKTGKGKIVVELFENQAPNTVANFISLAEKGFYDGTKFHRVIPNFMAQGGDPNSKEGATGIPGQGNPGYFIPDEVEREDHRKHFTGSLAMAKTQEPNTGGCQFYITVMPTPHLDGIHTVFGRVLEGRDIVRRLEQNDVIESVTITRKREHEYKPQRLPLPGATTVPDDVAETQPAETQPVETQPDTQPATTQP
jgi:cyclophilin family peptidyl-prolyl cis-trans isomerase